MLNETSNLSRIVVMLAYMKLGAVNCRWGQLSLF